MVASVSFLQGHRLGSDYFGRSPLLILSKIATNGGCCILELVVFGSYGCNEGLLYDNLFSRWS